MSQNKLRVKGTTTGVGCDSAIAWVRVISPSENIILVRDGQFNPPTYTSGGGKLFRLSYNGKEGGVWNLMGNYSYEVLVSSNPGNEDYPWLATWPEGWVVSKQCPMS
jgi:hypothetical protein